MLQNRTLALSVSACLLLVAGLAWAATEAELETEAEALLDDYQVLELDIDACPDGKCPEAQDLVDQLDAYGLELDQLHADRNALTSCTCATLDTLLDDLDDIDAELRVITDNWSGGD